MYFTEIPLERYHDVILHLRETFFADEPLNKAMQLCQPGEGHLQLERHSLSTLEDGLSVMAVTDDDEIVGVALNGILHVGDIEKAQRALVDNTDKSFKNIFTLLYEANLKIDFFSKFNVDKMFEIRILSVDSRFRGQGLAKSLLLKSEEVARDNSFKVMKTDATGLFSQKISASIGFSTFSEVQYDRYLDQDGGIVFVVDPPHDKLKVMCKLLE